MKILTLLFSMVVCMASITYGQTEPKKAAEPAMMLMSEAPPQIEISLIDGTKFRARKVAELSGLDFKNVTSFIFYYPDGDNDQDKFGNLLDSLLNGSPNLEVLNFSYGKIKKLPKIVNINAKLKKLDLSHNELATQPIGLENFPNLEHLNLEDNQLTALPHSISLLKNLNFVDISLNYIDRALFLKSLSAVKYKGILRLLKLGLADRDYEQIKANLKFVEVQH